MHHRARFATVVATGLLLTSLTACAGDSWQTPHASPTAVGTPAAGFVPAVAPSPEATVTPEAGSWEGVHPSAGYRVVLVTAGDEDTTTTLGDAVTRWADAEDVDLRTLDAGDDPVDALVTAMGMGPDLIVSVGEGLIDVLAVVSANHLDESFLVLGAEIGEPTYNVTAVDWSGAGYRGSENGTATDYDPASFTAERGDAAIRAGTTAILSGMTGIVLWIG